MKKHQAPFLKKVQHYAPQTLGFITAGLFLSAIIALFIAGVIPFLYLAILAVLGGVGLWLTIAPLFAKKPKKGRLITASVLSVIISAISIAALSFSISLISFLSSIQEDEYTTETYSIVAKTSRSMTTDAAKTAGLVQTDPYTNEVKRELPNHTKAKTEEFPTARAAIDSLGDESLDTTVFNTANLQLAKETSETFDSTFEVIKTFTIKVKSNTTKAKSVNASEPFAVYISGVDTYGEISTVSRSDVNMLAVVNPQKRSILLVNTPRDYYVQLHGTTGTKDKLTHAGVYGIDMSRKTLEDLYQIEIPYYIRVNFSSLVTIVDTVGGVEVYSDRDFKSFRVGANQLDGTRALEFSRERYSFSEGDRQRGRNQQRVIEALVSKLSTPGTLANYQSVLGATQKAVQTNMPPQFITSLINTQLQNPQRWSTSSISVDGTGSTGPTYSMGAQPLYIMIPNEASLGEARAQIKTQLTQN